MNSTARFEYVLHKYLIKLISWFALYIYGLYLRPSLLYKPSIKIYCMRLSHSPLSLSLSHLSAGVGRTGVFCALSNLIERLKTEHVMDVFQTVKMLRQKRPAMVQTKVCFFFNMSIFKQFGAAAPFILGAYVISLCTDLIKSSH